MKTREERWLERAKRQPRFAKFLKNSIKDIKDVVQSGETTRKIFDVRINICKNCEFFTKWARCLKCGCFMKKKARYKGASCPINKWEKEKGE